MGNQLSVSRMNQSILYAAGPFFAYPYKPVLNVAFGGGYEKSFKHFRMQHMDGMNLFYHCLCMIWQLSSNYALLGEIDDFFDTGSTVRTLTSAIWSLHLLTTSPTPLAVKVLSLASVLGAHVWMGSMFAQNWRTILFFQGFIEAAAVQLMSKGKRIKIDASYICFFIFRTVLWKVVCDNEGILKEHSRTIVSGLLILLLILGATRKPIAKTVSMGLYGWIVAMLCGSKAMYFWSCGMMATLCQGVAHNISGESGTLQVLEASKMDTTSYELSHTVFFPNLVFQSVLEHLSGKGK